MFDTQHTNRSVSSYEASTRIQFKIIGISNLHRIHKKYHDQDKLSSKPTILSITAHCLVFAASPAVAGLEGRNSHISGGFLLYFTSIKCAVIHIIFSGSRILLRIFS